MESELYKLVGAPLSAMGHNVQSTSGSIVGGFQSIMMVPGPDAGTPGGSRGGYYRPLARAVQASLLLAWPVDVASGGRSLNEAHRFHT
jgi:hypothetical protein